MKQSKFYLVLLLLLCAFQEVYALKDPPKVWGTTGEDGANAYDKDWYKDSSTTLTLDIADASQLGSFIKALNDKHDFSEQTVNLTVDLDMSKYQWTCSETVFKGIFNGNGHKISNLTYGADGEPFAFIGQVDGGEVNNLIISGELKGNTNVGGIVGKLTNNGKVSNSGYVGLIGSTAPAEGNIVKLGGVVGINEGGLIDNCFFAGTMLEVAANTDIGNIAGSSSEGSITNFYFKENALSDLSIGDEPSSAGEGLKSSDAFASGEVSWLLNQTSGENSKWSVNDGLPTFATEANPVVYKITYEPNDLGTVTGLEYVKAGSEVTLSFSPLEGYLGDEFVVTGVEVELEDNTFVMPASDISVSGKFVEYVAPVVAEATDVESSSFVANWSVAEQGATEYFLTVTDEAGTILDTYNNLSVGDVTSYQVTNLLPETTYKYYVQAKKNDLLSQKSSEISVTTVKGPVISYSPLVSTFKIDRKSSASQLIKIIGSNLTSEISLVIAGTNPDNFSLSANTLALEGGDLTITYNSSELGTHSATLTLSSEGAADVIIALNGSTELVGPLPMITAVGKNSFSVRWNAIPLAESYLVSLTKNGTVVEGYDNVSTTECSYEFLDLDANTAYTCTITSVLGEVNASGEPVIVTTANEYGYGQQLNNSGFENWEGTGDNAEPVDWNSFMTCTGTWASTAKSKHMEVSSEVRPNSSGISSVKIWTKDVSGIAKANGNLTCGQIVAGSTTPNDPKNHNVTVLGNPAFSEPMNGYKPDSLTVWVKYTPKEMKDRARVAATIHDNYAYQDPSNGSENDSHVVAKAILNYSATEDAGWQRLSIPFRYIGPATSADYMLVTFTSNMTPGEGNDNDSVLIDDMLLVYNPKVAISSLDKASYAQGAEISVEYTLEGTMSPYNINAEPNVVTLQLSDVTGSFENPIELASVTTDMGGTLIATLPDDLPTGKGYRVRVVTTNYPMISDPNANDIRIYTPGEANIDYTNPKEFSTVAGASVQQTITVEGASLANDITVALEDENQVFSIGDVTTLSADGGDLVVTYTPTSIGINTATITLNSVGLKEPVVITLSGVSRPVAPVIGEATNITPVGFTANWGEVADAQGYELTITPEVGDVIVKPLDVVTSYTVDNLPSATSYTYSVTVKVSDISSLPSEVSAPVVTLNKPVVAADKTALEFEETAVGEASEAQVVTIEATDLFGDIVANVTGSDYTVSPATLSKDEENRAINVTLTPSEANYYCNATLTLTTEYGNTITIPLTGSSIPQSTVALNGTEVGSDSFVANWNAVDVEDVVYKLTVKKDGEPLEGYNQKRIRNGANSCKVEGLEPNTTYTYDVIVVASSLDSKPSNEIEVTTTAANSIDVVSANISAYPNPVNDILYIKGCEAKEISIYSVDGMYIARFSVEDNRVDVANLAAGSYLVTVISNDGQVYKTRIMKK